MLKSPYTLLLILFSVAFIGIGDRVLPEPMKSASSNTRNTINKHLISLFPKRESKLKPHERTKKAIEEAEEENK